MVVHHLAVDGVSWRILLEDLQSGLRASREGRGGGAWGEDELVPAVGREAGEYSRSEELRQEVEYWLEQAAASRGVSGCRWSGGGQREHRDGQARGDGG